MNITRQPDSRFADWHLNEIAADGDTDTLVNYLKEAEYGAFEARTTDRAAWERAWGKITDLLIAARK